MLHWHSWRAAHLRISGTSHFFFELSGAMNSTIGSDQIEATEWDSTPKRCSRASRPGKCLTRGLPLKPLPGRVGLGNVKRLDLLPCDPRSRVGAALLGFKEIGEEVDVASDRNFLEWSGDLVQAQVAGDQVVSGTPATSCSSRQRLKR